MRNLPVQGFLLLGDELEEVLDELGLGSPRARVINHAGEAQARVQTWDGKKWNFTSDWYQGDEKVLRPLVMLTSGKYAEEKKITPRTPEQCKQ